jgi:hypothetical protein
MDFINIIKTIIASVLLTITSFFTPTNKINTPIPTPSIIIETPTPTTAIMETTELPTQISNINLVATVSPSPIPAPSQETIDKCNQLSHPKVHFSGIKCYPEELKQYLKDEKIDSDLNTIRNSMFRMTLPLAKNRDIQDYLMSSCLKIGPIAYEQCNKSLPSNLDRFKSQILEKYASEFKSCLSEVAEGDNETKNIVKDLFWKAKMKEKMDEIYSFCSKNGNSFDKYNF